MGMPQENGNQSTARQHQPLIISRYNLLLEKLLIGETIDNLLLELACLIQKTTGLYLCRDDLQRRWQIHALRRRPTTAHWLTSKPESGFPVGRRKSLHSGCHGPPDDSVRRTERKIRPLQYSRL